MMFASHYMSNWTSVLSLCEMPIRRGVCGEPRGDSDFVVARDCGLFAHDGCWWRSEDRRYEGNTKRQVNGARLMAAATNSTATSRSKATSRLERFCFSSFVSPVSAFNPAEVKNEKLQH
jgi:hypothetical protein